MLRPRRFLTTAALVLAAASITSLSACASGSAGEGADGGLSLAQIKSPVQLLRNEVANRIDTALIDEVVQPKDGSTSCLSESEDPDGISRTWESSVLVLIKKDTDENVGDVVDDLVATFVEQGWTAGEGDSSKVTKLTNPNSLVDIELFSVKPDKVGGVGAQIQILTGGPCVDTDGEDSAYVRNLEGR